MKKKSTHKSFQLHNYSGVGTLIALSVFGAVFTFSFGVILFTIDAPII